jgi:predicted RNA-binding Zn ribbon-like protein
MEALCLDVLNSDWHDWHGSGRDEDRLLKEGWLEQLVEKWQLGVSGADDERNIVLVREIRVVMQQVVEQLLQKKRLTEHELAPLNAYLQRAPRIYQVRGEGKGLNLEQVGLGTEWERVVGEIVLSFARLLTEDVARIKQCENPDCRWVYYDESANQTRRWCEESCANLIRVRRFREKRRRMQGDRV